MSDEVREMVERLREPVYTEETMRRWDSWRVYIAGGGGGSWPRDAFEALLDAMDIDRGEAADLLARVAAERDFADDARQEALRHQERYMAALEKAKEALAAIRDEAGTHTVAIGQQTGFARVYNVASAALAAMEARYE